MQEILKSIISAASVGLVLYGIELSGFGQEGKRPDGYRQFLIITYIVSALLWILVYVALTFVRHSSWFRRLFNSSALRMEGVYFEDFYQVSQRSSKTTTDPLTAETENDSELARGFAIVSIKWSKHTAELKIEGAAFTPKGILHGHFNSVNVSRNEFDLNYIYSTNTAGRNIYGYGYFRFFGPRSKAGKISYDGGLGQFIDNSAEFKKFELSFQKIDSDIVSYFEDKYKYIEYCKEIIRVYNNYRHEQLSNEIAEGARSIEQIESINRILRDKVIPTDK
ncbi:hypothetical protein [Acuticoccus mangrovi]|uniref:Uncharacterized protein n=1 Tax=Acuticoccus mangrovi TaxID=2796142 RepID=A0A934IDW1_9HYPH|nr:hypothetical protein [Acuticoccus mangrovi]MBJ3774738.1 hypothetical protein [Acuticoccus mangrovi]